MKGVVLAAGKGVRMRELTRHFAKPLLPVATKPILGWTLEALKAAGIDEVLLVVGYRRDQVRRTIGDGAPYGLRVHYVEQAKAQGTGQAAMLGRDFTGDEPFVLVFGDVLTPPHNIPALVRRFEQTAPDAMMTTHWVEDPCDGAAVYVEHGRVTRIVEKPPRGTSTTHLDNAGIFVFTPLIYELLDRVEVSPRGEYELTDALHMLTQQQRTLRAHELEGFWANVTSPEELLRTNRHMLVHRRSINEQPDVPGLHPFAAADPTARIGDCIIGENVSIGPRSTIGDNAALTWAVVSRNATVGCSATVEYAFLLPGAKVADGTTLVGTQDAIRIVGK
ncbi:MAG: NTP transferase domain-containing protein [Verrucomicrobia bacterium]|nr:NTP transferase domain-containing protein [Verrucomicrobiota bacterium]